MKNVTIGILCYAKIYLLAWKQVWLFGLSNSRDFLTVHSTNTRLDYARTEVSKLGTGLLGHLFFCVTWANVRLLLIIAKNHGLESKSIDFFFAFPQAGLVVPVYMELSTGMNPSNVSDGDQRQYKLKLNKSLYGLKQAGYNYNRGEKLCKGLITCNFIQSQVNKCVFFERIVLHSPMLMIVLYLARIWRSLMQLFLPWKIATKTLIWSTRNI